ncbi:hypothetical protein HK102_004712, partial [Quaeritorhiza haematococci]
MASKKPENGAVSKQANGSATTAQAKSDENIFLFIPNLIGYARVILVAIALYLLPSAPYIAMAFYSVSCLLDAVDGHAARYFNQSTKFGAVLDMVTDRSTTTCLLVHLTLLHPSLALLFQFLISLDLSSHYMQMYSSLTMGATSHKDVSKTANPLLRLYYTDRNVLFLVCAGNELFFILFYLLNWPDPSGSLHLLTILAVLMFPVCAFKQVVNVIQLISAIVYRADISTISRTQVTLVSGGGSGHEPSHAGFIGDGMLSAVAVGDVFASPSAAQVFEAIRVSAGPKGVLLIVKNYTGDRLQFGKAAERAKKELGIRVEMVIVDDDRAILPPVGVEGAPRKGAGRRGLAGTLFVHKIAGAMARRGASLDEILTTTRSLVENMGTVGVALTPCHIPGRKGRDDEQIKGDDDMMEVGLGIHGESGAKRIPLKSAKETAAMCLDMILSYPGATVWKGDKVVLLVNNLGGTSVLEIGVITNDAVQYLLSKSITPTRVLTGTLMTSLDMVGCSFTLLKLPSSSSSSSTSASEEPKQILQDLDSPVGSGAWPRGNQVVDAEVGDAIAHVEEGAEEKDWRVWREVKMEGGRTFATIIHSICTYLIAAEAELNKYDAIVGDGDCGSTLARGAQAILSEMKVEGGGDARVVESTISFDGHPSEALGQMSLVVEAKMGGSSGAMYCLFLDAAANRLSKIAQMDITLKDWSDAISDGTNAIQHYGGAQPGDRTMIDALLPTTQTLS